MATKSAVLPRATEVSESSQPNPIQHLLQIGTGYVLSSCLWVAAELKIADLLSGEPKDAPTLAAETGMNADILNRLMGTLTMAGIFARADERRYTLTPTSVLLRSDVQGSQRDSIVWIADPFHMEIFGALMQTVKTGQPAIEHVTGKPAFECFAGNPVENARFNAAMTTLSSFQVPAVLDAYDFSGFSTVVDVAGGHGFAICEILRRYPHLKGILFDLDHVTSGADHRICSLQLQGRCRTVAGDFFQSVPAGGDAYILKMIIHDWDDEKATTILRNCRKALEGKPNGKVLILEMVMPEDDEVHFSRILDMEMAALPGGRERTEGDFRKLLAGAGLRLTRLVPTKSPMCVVEAALA